MSDMNTSSSLTKPLLVIVGNGMATGRLLDEIIKLAPNKYQITVVGEEPQGSYNRILLSSVLAKELHYKNIILKPAQWYKDNNITFLGGTLVTHINREEKIIYLDHDEILTLNYDKLVLATGSRSASIPAKNQKIEGIFSFRNISDTQKIEDFTELHKEAVVIGGGLLGLEAAYGLASNGNKVTLIHRNKWLLNRQLDEVAGKMLQKVMANKNIEFVLGHEVTRFDHLMNKNNQPTVAGVELTNGSYLKAELVIIATGITPNAELAVTAGLDVNRAIIVDDFLQTSDPDISALGECCEHKKSTFGLVDPIWKQCESLALYLTSLKQKKFKNTPVATKLKVSGVQLFSAGMVESSPENQTYTINDKKAAVYRKLIIKNNVIVGIVLFGDVSSGMEYFDLMQNKTPVENHLPELIIGAEYMINDKSTKQCAA